MEPKDLVVVQEELIESCTKWYNIGLKLNVSINTLDSIKSQFNDPEDCLRETLKVWLKTADKTTWKTLVDALKSPTVKESWLAARLKGKYCVATSVKENEEQAHQIQDLNQQTAGLQTQLKTRAQKLQEENDIARQSHSEIQYLRQKLKTRDQEKDQLQAALETSQHEIQQLRQEVAQRDDQAQQALDHLKQAEEVRQSEIQQLRHKLKERDRQVQETIKARQSEIQQFKQALESRDQQLKAKDNKIQEKDEALIARQKEIEELRSEQHTEEAEKSPVTKKRRKNEDLDLQSREQSQTEDIQGKLNWKELPNVPTELQNVSSAIIDGKMVYISDNTNTCVYDLDKLGWSMLLECPHTSFSLAVVKGQLTAIGGCNAKTHQCTNRLLSFTRGSIGSTWTEQFPPMPTTRTKPAVACSEKALIIAGGHVPPSSRLVCTQVEVMDTETEQWFTASRPLRKDSEWCTITTTRDTLYIHTATCASYSAWPGDEVYTPQMITCSITDLLQLEGEKWYGISSIPSTKITVATIRGQLMAISVDYYEGYDDDTNIHLYDPKNYSWKVIGNVPTAELKDIQTFSGNGLITGVNHDGSVTIFIVDLE